MALACHSNLTTGLFRLSWNCCPLRSGSGVVFRTQLIPLFLDPSPLPLSPWVSVCRAWACGRGWWLHARFRLVIQCHLSLKLYAPTQFHLRPCVRVQKYDSPTSLSYQGVRYVGREGEASRSRARSKGLHSLNFQSAGPGRGH